MRFGDALNNGIFLSWHYLVENPESKVLGTIWKRIESAEHFLESRNVSK